jgi:REP element-mobilizing transposase RayT
MGNLNYKFFYRRNLPHIQPSDATFFVTLRLAGSLPKAVLAQWREDREPLMKAAKLDAEKEETEFQKRERMRLWFRRFEELLDGAQHGPTWLKDERIAALVAESLRYRDEQAYRLDAYCILPNHVHAVFEPLPMPAQELPSCSVGQDDILSHKPRSLALIMHSLKRHTVLEANRLLRRRGAFWEHENYDHYVRSPQELERILVYVLNNPVKAGLAREWPDWKWNYCRYATL